MTRRFHRLTHIECVPHRLHPLRRGNEIGIGAALLRTPPTPPSMRVRTRRFAACNSLVRFICARVLSEGRGARKTGWALDRRARAGQPAPRHGEPVSRVMHRKRSSERGRSGTRCATTLNRRGDAVAGLATVGM